MRFIFYLIYRFVVLITYIDPYYVKIIGKVQMRTLSAWISVIRSIWCICHFYVLLVIVWRQVQKTTSDGRKYK
jgi:hypothetical protein